MREEKKQKSTLIRWDHQEKIIRIKILLNISESDAKNDVGILSEIFDGIPEDQTIKILSDVSSVSKVWDLSSRKVYTELLKKYNKRHIKAAMIGANNMIKLIAGFVFAVGDKKNFLKFFDNSEDGLKWLKN